MEEINASDVHIFAFIQDVMIGIELRIWDQLENTRERIKTPEAMYLGVSMIEFYLTNVHKSLLEKSDELIIETFNKFSEFIPLEQKYILNLLTNTINRAYAKLPRSKLITESKDEFLKSLKEVMLLMKKYILYCFNEDLKKLINN